MLDFLLQDLRLSLRSLRRSPGFAAATILSLSIGIGAVTALFSMIDAIFFRPFPVHEPDRLVSIYGRLLTEPGRSRTSYPDYVYYREQTDVFSGLMAFVRASVSFNAGNRTALLWGEEVTWNYFDVLGLATAVGRGFRPDEDRPGAPHPVVVISHGLWQRAFSGDPGAVGRSVRINGRSFTIVGIAPRGFRGVTLDEGRPPELWLPIGWRDQDGARGGC